MSSSGVDSVNSGPLIIRTYLDESPNNTYVLGQYDRSIPPNRVLVTSTGGLLVPSDSFVVSSISVSTLTASTIIASNVFISTAYVSTLSTCDIFCPDVLTISSFRQTYLGAEQFEYRSSDPSTIGAFKVELYGSNLLAWRSTFDNVNATVVQNNGGGQLVLATDEPIMYFNGAANGNNHVGIGTSTPMAHLHIGEPNFSQVFTTSGSFTVPSGITTLNFEMIGAGGPYFDNDGLSGTGGYIKGSINVSGFIGQTISTIVGITGSAGTPDIPSGASYLYIENTGPLFVMAGAGGSASNAGAPQYGGWGGGGTSGPGSFVEILSNEFVAVGGDGDSSGGGSGGGGGQTTSGGAAGVCGDPRVPEYPGNGRGPPTIPFEEALGGSGGDGVPGGSGYTGGGEGCGGGGGSSYYNGLYTTITTSYPGNTLPSAILPGYGRNAQDGYVKISYSSGEPSLVTDGAVGIGTIDPVTTLQVNGSLSTLTIYDNNGSSGTSGQVLTAGAGNQVVWGSSSGPVTTTISTTGLYTLSSYVSPTIRYVRLVTEACGGGGGGGSGNGGNINPKSGGGGGGSGYLSVFESVFSTITQLNITIGNGGSGITSSDGGSTIVANIVPGVDPLIAATSTIFVGVAGGKAGGIGTGSGGDGYFGGGGGASNDDPGGPGASGGVGFISPAYDGQQGDAGVGYPPGTGKAGSGGGSYIYNGGINTAATGAAGGGGGGPMGGAGGGYANGNYYSASNGLFGGGGGGALWLGDSGSFGNSGNGGDGYVILTMYPL